MALIPEDVTPNSHRCENPKSNVIKSVYLLTIGSKVTEISDKTRSEMIGNVKWNGKIAERTVEWTLNSVTSKKKLRNFIL